MFEANDLHCPFADELIKTKNKSSIDTFPDRLNALFLRPLSFKRSSIGQAKI